MTHPNTAPWSAGEDDKVYQINLRPCIKNKLCPDVCGMIPALMIVGLCARVVCAAPSFQGLGDLSGGMFESRALAVSADGSVVVGSASSASGTTEAFRWSLANGMVGLGDLPGGDFFSAANDVSADGSVIVGNSRSSLGDEAFRWVSGQGMTGLGDLPGGAFNSDAWGISANGSIVAGTSSSDLGFVEAYRWTAADGMVGIGSLPGAFFESRAIDVSGNGLVVVGRSVSSGGENQAFRWTQSEGMVALDTSPNAADIGSKAAAVSSDGATIVGSREGEAFRWTEADGMVGLGMLSGGISSATDVSGNGSFVVGSNWFEGVTSAFIWDPVNGMRELQSVLTDLGLDLTGWTLETATGISDDGLTIVGTGINPDGNTEAFIARLPEPGTLVLTLAGLALGCGSRLGRR